MKSFFVSMKTSHDVTYDVRHMWYTSHFYSETIFSFNENQSKSWPSLPIIDAKSFLNSFEGVLRVVRKSREVGVPFFLFHYIFMKKFSRSFEGVHEVPPPPPLHRCVHLLVVFGCIQRLTIKSRTLLNHDILNRQRFVSWCQFNFIFKHYPCHAYTSS